MKFLSVMFTVALFVTANGLAQHLRRANALPIHLANRSPVRPPKLR
jgi:hypothetical protein